MKRGILLLLAVWFSWLCAACTASEMPLTALPAETNTSSATTSALQPVTPTASTTPMSTETPMMALPTETAEPVVATAIEEATGEPFAPGFIALAWNPDEEEDRWIMTYQLDFIYPGASPDSWSSETMLEDLPLSPYMFPSPDQNKLLLLQYKDSNEDGRIPSLGNADAYDIYLYQIVDETLILLAENDEYYQPEFFWLPDSQSFVYRLRKDVVQIDITEPTPIPVIDTAITSYIRHALSPDGTQLAVFTALTNEPMQSSKSDRLDNFDLVSGKLINIVDETGAGSLIWSPNSQWLAFSHYIQGLYLFDLNIPSAIELVTDENSYVLFEWSPNSNFLAYSYDRKNIHIWNADKGQDEAVYTLESDPETGSQFYVYQFEWLPDGLGMVMATGTTEKNKLVGLDTENGIFKDLLIIDVLDPEIEEEPLRRIYDFSPDGQWLLFYGDIEGTAGFYVIHRDGGDVYLALENVRRYFVPLEVFWLDVDS